MRKICGVALIGVLSLFSCNNSGTDSSGASGRADRLSDKAGGVTFLLRDADLIQVDSNPQYNTAEWNFVVDKAGRYDVWLSSLTCDTLGRLFSGNVTITAGDSRLQKTPVGDEIIKNDKSVKSPWVRADSHMGSVFFSEPGEYQIQLISDKVIPQGEKEGKDAHTFINSVILKPSVN